MRTKINITNQNRYKKNLVCKDSILSVYEHTKIWIAHIEDCAKIYLFKANVNFWFCPRNAIFTFLASVFISPVYCKNAKKHHKNTKKQ